MAPTAASTLLYARTNITWPFGFHDLFFIRNYQIKKKKNEENFEHSITILPEGSYLYKSTTVIRFNATRVFSTPSTVYEVPLTSTPFFDATQSPVLSDKYESLKSAEIFQARMFVL